MQANVCSGSYESGKSEAFEDKLSTIGDISNKTKWIVSKRYVQATLVIVLVTLAIAIPFFTRAFALTDVRNAGVFELDGNIVKDSGTALPTDWGTLFDASGNTQSLPSGGLDAHWINDGPHAVTDTSTFTTGSKDTLDIANGGWQCAPSNNLTPKDDILHSYSFAIIPQSGSRTGDLIVYAGFERFANTGAADLGLWLLQDPTVACSSTKSAVSFTGGHTVGDLLIVGEFSTGGSVTTLKEYEWVGISKAVPNGVMNITVAGAVDCTVASATSNICARSNTAPISTLPWSTQDKTSTANTLATAEFFEVGIDLTGLLGPNPPCINRFLFDTRTSFSLDATLKDYAVGALTTCPTAAISTSVSPSVIALGSSATDTATVTLNPGGSIVNGTVDFKVYGPVATNTPTCTNLAGSFSGVSIGPGVSPQSATSGTFTPSAAGYYFWTATYNPFNPRNGNTNSTMCGDTGETLLVVNSAITTSVSPSTIALGSSATDTATVMLLPPGQTVSGTVDFFVYGPVSTNIATCTTIAASFTGVAISGSSPASVTSPSFTPSAPGFYFWTATYNPAGPANGPTAHTTCGDTGETLNVVSIPKITAFDFTNTPTNNNPTLGSGTVTYAFTIHNYGAATVTLSGSLVVSGTASVTCTGGNTLTLTGSVAAGGDASFSLSCSYSGNSGQTVSAAITAMFTDINGFTGAVSGSPTTYTFTIQRI